MTLKTTITYISIFAIHIVLLMVAFIGFRLHPMDIIFGSAGDGIKNLFTLVSYSKDHSLAGGFLKFHGMCYPFGDYIYYADNTPVFSIPFRWFCLHITDLSAYTLPIYNIFIISNIAFSGMLIYYIFSKLFRETQFSYILAIVLPWTNTQVGRIWWGHYSLSLSCWVLLAIVTVMLWDKYKDFRRKQIFVSCAMCFLCVTAFFAHGYYLAIITLFIASMLFIYGICTWKQPTGKFTIMMSFLFPVITVGIIYTIIALTDPYLKLRPATANGYDWMEQKIRFSYLFSHNNFQNIYFPISSSRYSFNPEQCGYLGNIGLYAFAAFAIASFINRQFRTKAILLQKQFFKDPLKTGIFLGSTILLFISMGELYYTSTRLEDSFTIVNLLNPFLYLHLFTNAVAQFRSLERFAWPFFYGFYVWVMFSLINIYKSSGNKLKIAIFVATVFLGGAEVKDYIDEFQGVANNESFFNKAHEEASMPKHINVRNYQAILPIPYYMVGVEDTNYRYCINDYDPWAEFTYMLSYSTGLPLMSCNLSRTPPKFARILDNFAAYDSLDKELTLLVNEKPILIAVKSSQLDRKKATMQQPNEENWQYYEHSLTFAERHHLVAIDSIADVIFYEYYIPKK